MSRSFTPPDTLSKDDIRAVADVRREIWTSGFYGIIMGGTGGLVGHSVAHMGQNRQWYQLGLNKNTRLATVILGSCACSFVMATTTGKNQVHNLHPIYERGARPPPVASYQESLQAARDRAAELNMLERQRQKEQALQKDVVRATSFVNGGPDDNLVLKERFDRERNRVFRRATLRQSMQQHGGLSDSHGGHWVKDGGISRQ